MAKCLLPVFEASTQFFIYKVLSKRSWNVSEKK